MTKANHPLSINLDPLNPVRMVNFRWLIACLPRGGRARFARAVHVSQCQLSQHMQKATSASFRPVGERFSRRIENVFGLPAGCMDLEQGVLPHLDLYSEYWRKRDFVTVTPDGPAPDIGALDGTQLAASGDAPVSTALRPKSRTQTPKKALHQATLEALEDALHQGKIDDKECLRLIGLWV